MLETKLGSARRAIHALNCCAISPAPVPGFSNLSSGDLNSRPYDYASRALTSYLHSLVPPIFTDRRLRLRSVPAPYHSILPGYGDQTSRFQRATAQIATLNITFWKVIFTANKAVLQELRPP